MITSEAIGQWHHRQQQSISKPGRQQSLQAVRRLVHRRHDRHETNTTGLPNAGPSLWIVGCNPLTAKHGSLLAPVFGKAIDRSSLLLGQAEERARRQKAIEDAMREFDERRSANAAAKLQREAGKDTREVREPRKVRVVAPPLVIAPNKYRYFLGGGNNFELIERVLKTRPWWENVGKSNIMINLFMTQCTRKGEFEKYSGKENMVGSTARCINRFEGFKELTDKDLMFINLFKYCERNKLNVYDYVPLTLVIDFDDPHFEKKVMKFARTHRSIEIFNEQLARKIIIRFDNQYYIDKETHGKLTGTKKEQSSIKAKKKKKAKKTLQSSPKLGEVIEEDNSGDSDDEKPQAFSGKKNIKKQKKADPLMFVDHLNNWKHEFNLDFLPQTRKEYNDPTDKYKYSIPKIDDPFNRGHNIWLVKPSGFCRGRGIEIFTELGQLNEHLPKFYQGYNDWETLEITEEKKRYYSLLDEKNNMKDIKLKSSNLVIQKYLEDPMLIRGRKFDLRVFVMITPWQQVFIFDACYVRLSSEVMDLTNKKDLTNKYMHLTNNAIQELGKNYSVHEKGNIISIPRMEEILKEEGKPLDFESVIWPQICEAVRISTLSCAHLLNPNKRSHCFEVYGYDFMIDRSLKSWLIEINTNPSLSESNDTVKTIIERMFDDAFKITIDKIFKPKKPGFTATANLKSPEANKNVPQSSANRTGNKVLGTEGAQEIPSMNKESLTLDTSLSQKLDSPSLGTRIKSSQSAKADFRITVSTKPSLGSFSKTEEQSSTEGKHALRRSVLSKKLTVACSHPIQEQEKEENLEAEEALEGNLTKGINPEKIMYKTPSEFPLSYKDNYKNLW